MLSPLHEDILSKMDTEYNVFRNTMKQIFEENYELAKQLREAREKERGR